MVGIAAGEDLRFGFQPPEGTGVNDAVAIALEVIAVGMRRLGVAASPRVFHAHRVIGQHAVSVAVVKISEISRLARHTRFPDSHFVHKGQKMSDNRSCYRSRSFRIELPLPMLPMERQPSKR